MTAAPFPPGEDERLALNGNETLGRRVLVVLFGLNAIMFVVEISAGWSAESMGLIADGLDMGADAGVYLLAMAAIGASASKKIRAARTAGYVQLALALGAILEVGRRWLVGSAPESDVMVGMSLLAMAVNVGCLVILRKYRSGEVHLQAAWIFSATDVQANLGVLVAGVLVSMLESSIPDLIIGTLVSLLVLRGAVRIGKRVRIAQMSSKGY